MGLEKTYHPKNNAQENAQKSSYKRKVSINNGLGGCGKRAGEIVKGKIGYVWYFPPRDIKEKEEFYLGILVGVLLLLLAWGCCFCFGILWGRISCSPRGRGEGERRQRVLMV